MDKSFEQAMQIRAKKLEVEKTAEIESTITELVSITNRSRIYGSTRILGPNSMQTDEVADLLNRSLSAIQTLRRIIRETITLQKDPIETPNDNSAGVVKVEIKAIHFNF